MSAVPQLSSLFLIAGQSNAVGQGDGAKSEAYFHPHTFEYDGLQHQIKSLKDPIGQVYHSLEAANTGSIGPAFAATYARLSQSKVCLIMAARGGSSCCAKAELADFGTWAETGQLFNASLQKVKNAEELSKTPLTGIIWMQGERDANAINDKKQTATDFEKSLELVIKRFRKALNNDNLPFYIVQTGYQMGRPVYGNDRVRAAQLALTKRLRKVALVYADTPDFFNKNWMKDEVHFAQEGLNHIGETAAANIYQLNFINHINS